MYGSVPSPRPRARRRASEFDPTRLWRRVALAVAMVSVGLGACQASLDLEQFEFPEPSGVGGRSGDQSIPPLLPGGAANSPGGGENGLTPPLVPPEGDAGEDPVGGCAPDCDLPHARSACVDAGCIIEQCLVPWRDANGLAEDGCEAGDVPADGLTLWFMADRGAVVQPDGSVSAWNDQSRNGYAAIQSVPERRPSWQSQPDGLPMLSFDGADDYFDLPPGFASFDGSSFFAVVEAEPNDRCAGILHFSNGPDADDVEFGRHRTNLLYYEVQGDSIDGTTDGFVVGRRLVVSSVQAPMNGNVELRIDGAVDQTKAMILPANVERRINYVGRNAYTEQPVECSMYFRGRIGELLFYPRGLSAGERSRVEAYLHEKWQPD